MQFLIRRAKLDDVPTLVKLARMVHFINLPADREIIANKILQSRSAFARAAGAEVDDQPDQPPPKVKPGPTGVRRSVAAQLAPDTVTPHQLRPASELRASGKGRGKSARHSPQPPAAAHAPVPASLSPVQAAGLSAAKSDVFMFVLEDVEAAACLGTSQVISHMGGPGNPNLSFKLSRREFFSQSLQFGATHIVATLYLDESGPSELGGLILQPSYRSHKAKLGRLLSLVRFHFIALHRDMFSDRLIAELMAPISPDGQNVLWEYLGRRFINLTYAEADRFCQYSREFMLALLPREEIFLTLLPPEARAVIGQVGPETMPARKMLEKIGFRYKDFVDPFDGGPHLEANTGEIKLIRDTRLLTLGEPINATAATRSGIVSRLESDGEFRASHVDFAEGATTVRLTRESMKQLSVEPGMQLGVTPMEPPRGSPRKAPPGRKRA
ncbi:MAG: Arginine N-succinyltransferase [Phycisphaerales bacterium]|nr:Arginine N-succinyltransferase [Phycisphaerales bacterium]